MLIMINFNVAIDSQWPYKFSLWLLCRLPGSFSELLFLFPVTAGSTQNLSSGDGQNLDACFLLQGPCPLLSALWYMPCAAHPLHTLTLCFQHFYLPCYWVILIFVFINSSQHCQFSPFFAFDISFKVMFNRLIPDVLSSHWIYLPFTEKFYRIFSDILPHLLWLYQSCSDRIGFFLYSFFHPQFCEDLGLGT